MKHETHFTKEQIRRFHNHEMTQEELLTFMESMKRCSFCNRILADSFDDFPITPAPKNFKNSVIERSQQTDFQMAVRISDTAHNISNRTRLLLYSLKVSAAVVTALILLFSLPANLSPVPQKELPRTEAERYQSHSLKDNIEKGSIIMTEKINQLLNQFNNEEAMLYD